jgi:hypothetical protein
MIPTARVFPIPYFIFKGSLVDSRLRASNEHILIVHVPRAGERPCYPISFFQHPTRPSIAPGTNKVNSENPAWTSWHEAWIIRKMGGTYRARQDSLEPVAYVDRNDRALLLSQQLQA